MLFFAVGFQFFYNRVSQVSRSPAAVKVTLSPFGDNVYKQEAYYEQLEPGTQCKPRSLFPSELPVTRAMANRLLDEARKVATEFDFSPEDLNKAVKEYIREMAEGLEKQGTQLSQIPTYVTAVPNGTEKVTTEVWTFHHILTSLGHLSSC